MYNKFVVLLAIFILAVVFSTSAYAQIITPQPRFSPSPSPSVSPSPSPTPDPTPRPDLTQPTEETIGPLEKLLQDQKLGPVIFNPVKYAIRGAVDAGVAPNTIVLLLLLPLIAAIIAAARHVVGLRGFGIFLPASLAVVFIAIGPLLGIFLFVLIVVASTVFRMFLRQLKIRLQYLPRMALMLWAVVLSVLGILFMAPVIPGNSLTGVSIFPVLILALLAEDFSKIQLGKSAHTAVSHATETIILSLVSYMFLTLKPLQEAALLNPEWLIVGVAIFDILLGKYVGLRVTEYWRFRKLILNK